jgi:hypothetical protein
MARNIRHFVTSNGIAVIALFVALTGTASAATYVVARNSQIGPGTVSGHHPPSGKHANLISGSVATRDLRDGSVTAGKLATGSVNSAKIANGSVTGTDVQNGSIGPADAAPLTVTTVADAVKTSDACAGLTPTYNTFCSNDSANYWGSYNKFSDTNWEPVTVTKDLQGFVHLQGMMHCVAAGTPSLYCPSVVFILPPAFRPAASLTFAADSNSSAARIDVTSTGVVHWETTGGGDPSNYVSLSGLTFRAG